MLAAGAKKRPPGSIDVVAASRAATAARPNPFTADLGRAPTAFTRPVVSTPFGLFGGIEKAGPKARKKPEPKPPKAGAKDLKSLFGIDPADYAPNSKVADARRRAGVVESVELTRILEIPRRPSELASYATDGPKDLTSTYARPGGTMKLWPIQSAALHEAARVGGLLGPIGAGWGKGLLSLLLASAMKAKLAVILIPPSLRDQTMSSLIPQMNKHWLLPLANIRVVAYSELSNARSADILDELKPDVIISDECHNLKAKASARSKRFLRYMKEHPECRFVGLSGTITRKSLRDYQHLSELALKNYSPLPRSWTDLNDWSEAIDVSDDPMPPGALRQLCTPEECQRIDDPENGSNDVKRAAAQDAVRSGFRRRLVETPGVVATEEGALGTSLVLHGLTLPLPTLVSDALHKLRSRWEIAGEELTNALDVSRVARQLASGFYYRWVWPTEIRPDGSPDNEWLAARAAWHKEIREVLKRSLKGMDSPLLVTRAVHEGRFKSESWDGWLAVKDRYSAYPNNVPPREAVWISEFLIDFAIAWITKNATKTEPLIAWFSWVELGEKLAARGGYPFFGGGPHASRDIALVNVKKTPVIVASIKAHGVGKNLQAFSRNLILNTPSSGADYEQCLDAQTEILTELGWLGIDDVWGDVKAAAYDINDGSIHWSDSTRIERLLGDEKMFGISSSYVDMRVTAGHRLIHQKLTRKGDGGADGFVYAPNAFVAADSVPQRGRIPVAGNQLGKGLPLTNAELVFLGLFMTDGNLQKHSISLFQSEKYPQIIELIENTLTDCGFKSSHSVTTTPSNFGPRSPLHKWYVPKASKKINLPLRGWGVLEPYVGKDFPLSLDDATREQLIEILRGMWAGDGSKTQGSYAYNIYNPQTVTICSSRKVAVDRIQSLCIRRGLRCNVCKNGTMWFLHISYETTRSLVARMNLHRPVWAELPSVPTERVWCATVDTGAIVVRRNGKATVIGNCLARTHRPGQEADEVSAHILLHTPETLAAFAKALEDARYTESSVGQKQRLNYAQRVGC